jgi:uncharacterized membrane protein YedE/YeeE
MPFHVAALATGSKSFRDNPVIGSGWLNEKGLHVGRMAMAARLTAWRRARLAHLVSAGDATAFAVDGFILHARGLGAQPAVRVELWAYGRRNPFLPWLGFDPAGLPLVKGRAIPLSWASRDVAERLRLSRNTWRPAGMVGAQSVPDLALHRL